MLSSKLSKIKASLDFLVLYSPEQLIKGQNERRGGGQGGVRERISKGETEFERGRERGGGGGEREREREAEGGRREEAAVFVSFIHLCV